jgi:hypothetical protein
MAQDPRKRQKRLQKQAAKRKEKKHELIREKSAGIGERMTAATKYPVLDALVTEDFWTQGMGWVLLSRELPGRMVAVAVFLLDRYCLGVKNAMAQINSRSEYEREFLHKMNVTFSSRRMSPADVRKLVEEAVEYARDLGLPPHPDYQKARLLFGDIDAGQSTEVFEFGKDGKPFFVNGPNDTPERCRQIISTLTYSCGEGNFESMFILDPSQNLSLLSGFREGPSKILDADEDREDEDREDEEE